MNRCRRSVPVSADENHRRRENGRSKEYFTHDLLSAWSGYLDEGVDLPPLLREAKQPCT
ncbi:MAG: hypothetical protein KAV00_07735 [Phycisphaerae bacterium]|nr:hypothetical protein [Phycisphaerae bacterium]